MTLDDDARITEAIRRTEILRAPKQSLYSFGVTNIYYYLLTEPSYPEPRQGVAETVIREGKVTAERPRIVTPYYLSRLEGFGPEARRYFEALLGEHGADVAALLYAYKNEPKAPTIVSQNLPSVADTISAEIDRRGDKLAAIVRGEDALWDVSLLKFIFEITRSSLPDNIRQMGSRGLFKVDASGIPNDAYVRIEELFRQVRLGESEPQRLKDELDRWGLFEEYQDRFYDLFRR